MVGVHSRLKEEWLIDHSRPSWMRKSHKRKSVSGIGKRKSVRGRVGGEWSKVRSEDALGGCEKGSEHPISTPASPPKAPCLRHLCNLTLQIPGHGRPPGFLHEEDDARSRYGQVVSRLDRSPLGCVSTSTFPVLLRCQSLLLV